MKPNGVIEHRRRRKTQFMDWTGSNVDTYRQERTCAHSHTHTHVTKPKQSTLIDRLLRLWLPIRLPSSVTHKHTHPLPQLSIYLISLHCAATKQKEEREIESWLDIILFHISFNQCFIFVVCSVRLLNSQGSGLISIGTCDSKNTGRHGTVGHCT